MLWVKAFHIFFVVSWFAGLFYLPRLYVNHALVRAEGAAGRATAERLLLMERKLFRFMTPLGILALAFGFWLWLGFDFSGGWMHAKLLLVALLVAYHGYCWKLLREFEDGCSARSHLWFRWFNEAPVLLLLGAVLLVVLKPF